MATSGTRDFNLDIAEIIDEAYERVGKEAVTGYDAQRARRSLNIMLQEWANRGINLWALKRIETDLAAGDSEVSLAPYDLDIVEAYTRDSSMDYPMERITRSDYAAIATKEMTGRPYNLYVERTVPGKMFIWPVPDRAYTLVTYRIQALQDAGSFTNTAQVPQRFIPAMVAGLAYYLSMKVARDLTQAVKMEYEDELSRAINEDSERGSWFIRPGW